MFNKVKDEIIEKKITSHTSKKKKTKKKKNKKKKKVKNLKKKKNLNQQNSINTFIILRIISNLSIFSPNDFSSLSN